MFDVRRWMLDVPSESCTYLHLLASTCTKLQEKNLDHHGFPGIYGVFRTAFRVSLPRTLQVPYGSLRVPYGSATCISGNVHAGPYGSYRSSPPRRGAIHPNSMVPEIEHQKFLLSRWPPWFAPP